MYCFPLRLIHGQDVFEAFYKKDLAKRLLVFKFDFASLVHSSYREELDEDEEEQSEVLYQNMDEARQEIHLSSISMVETVVAVNHQQQSREEEELAQLSITSADYNKLSEEVERLQKQLAGMDDSRMETKSLNKCCICICIEINPIPA